MVRTLPLCFFLLLATGLGLAQSSGSVDITVLDDHDAPVSGATAELQPIGGVLGYVDPNCTSNASGTCTIDQLPFGNYSVSASKPADDYPRQIFAFCSKIGATLPTAALSGDHAHQAVTVHLGKRAGVLNGTVADAVTGKPLNANAEFRWVSDPRNFLRGTGLTTAKFRILVPSNTPFTMVVSLDGYQDWTYSLGPGSLRNAILLRPAEELTLDIRLWPKDR